MISSIGVSAKKIYMKQNYCYNKYDFLQKIMVLIIIQILLFKNHILLQKQFGAISWRKIIKNICFIKN